MTETLTAGFDAGWREDEGVQGPKVALVTIAA